MFDDVEPLFSYSRAQALEDGVLVNLSTSKECREAGIKYPVACTREVWETYIAWTAEDTELQTPQHQTGRLWDVLYMMRLAIQAKRSDGPELMFKLLIVPRDGHSQRAKLTHLKLMVGPGDNLEPVLTIMLPDQD